MKKFFAMLLVAVFAVAGTATASEQMGVYVTPKISLGITQYKLKGAGYNYAGGSFSNTLGSASKGTFGGGIALGYDGSKNMDLNVRTELEYMFFGDTKASYGEYYTPATWARASGKVGVKSLFLNVYYDFRNDSAFVPYVGGGIGFGMLSMKGSASTMDSGVARNASMGRKHSTNFAWNLGLGCAYEFTDNVALDLGYRYAHFGNTRSATWKDAVGQGRVEAKNVGMHQFTLGARLSF